MTTKAPGSYAPDDSKYGCLTDGAGTIVTPVTADNGSNKVRGVQAPDGSIYFCLTNGSGTLV